MEVLENINELGNKIVNNLNIENLQNNFLKTNIGQIANNAIDIGLKMILPDTVENEVIEVKDALISGGIDDAITTAVENAIKIGKKALGIKKINFESVGQAESALLNGDLKKGISNGIDFVIDKLNKSQILPDKICSIIKNGKDLILNQTTNDIKNDFSEEKKAVEKIEKYILNWEKCYKMKDLNGLNKEFNKIQKQMKKIIPLEKLIKNVNKIENINELIKNTDNFDFSNIYLDLAENI